ncbi:MAG TPA: thioredoxin domain-containing protein [Aquifex aeolicus]|nr:thioredoxin domain-containing protein [Aquifex aeolicus]
MEKRKPNRLIKESSPYLRQHAYNPVDWYPWCEEAFVKAKEEDKPIFLSIGYSTCHWCHVMEKESFEDEEIARVLNQHYVAIKVDREERPDIDGIYMSVCQMLTGSGGWPLTIIMTPDKEPFFAGTYFPKENIYGRPGLRDILLRIAQLWKEDREKVLKAASQVVNALKKTQEESYSGVELGEDMLHRGFAELRHTYDEVHGGFGGAPKFPIPHNLMFLMRYFRRYGEESALSMVVHTLKRMRLGGIWDHVGFGFHRYSTDREWVLPHFEKMLYDNALLMYAYSEVCQITKEDFFFRVVEEIGEYLLRDMLSPEGAFYSAQDADSEGEEGKFYVWSLEELRDILTKEELEVFTSVYSVSEEGVLYMKEEAGSLEGELRRRLEEIRSKLFKEREKRVKPMLDDKVLTDWNGLAVAAFSKAGVSLGRRDFVEVARKCVDFLLENMFEGDVLLHRYRKGQAGIRAFLEDYAYLIWGMTELYFATFDRKYLEKARELADWVLEHFWDRKNGGFFQTPDYGDSPLVRRKETYDGALPSGNSVMIFNLLRLQRALALPEYGEVAVRALEAIAEVLRALPSSHTFALIGLDLFLKGGFELACVPDGKECREGLLDVQRDFLPEGVFLIGSGELKAIEGRATYYLCKNFSCDEPTTDLGKVKEKL